jgi:hypothetical protein
LIKPIAVYAVMRETRDGTWEVVSAWTDEYDARYEVARWEQDSKAPYAYVKGTLLIGGEDESYAPDAEGNLQVSL